MALSIQQLREKRSTLARDLRNHLEKHPGAAWGAEQQTRYDEISAEIERTDGEIGRIQRVLDLEAQNAHRVEQVAEQRGVTLATAGDIAEAEKAIFDAYLRGGVQAAANKRAEFVNQGLKVYNTMSTTTNSEGGYTVPTGFAAQLIESMKAFGGMREVATVQSTTSGEPINYPTTDATSEVGEIVAQNASVAAADFTFGVKTIGAYKFSSKSVAVPMELLQDSKINLEAHITGRLGTRIARALNQYLTTGTGTNQPEGVVTAATLGKTGASGQTDSATYEDVIDLIHSVDPAYRAGARLMFCDSTLKILKKLKDSENRPLWVPGVAMREPDTINGFGYLINQDVAAMAAGAKSILFGDFSKYLLRDTLDVTLFRMTDSKYTEKGQVGFLAFSRHDGKLLDAAAVKYYANAAS